MFREHKLMFSFLVMSGFISGTETLTSHFKAYKIYPVEKADRHLVTDCAFSCSVTNTCLSFILHHENCGLSTDVCEMDNYKCLCYQKTESSSTPVPPKSVRNNSKADATETKDHGSRTVGLNNITLTTNDTDAAIQSESPFEPTNRIKRPHMNWCNPDYGLIPACKGGDLGTVKDILRKKLEDINCRGKSGQTPVMWAAGNRQVAVFDFLVSERCDLSLVADDNNTVLHTACKGGSTLIVEKLIDNENFDIEEKGPCGRTPLLTAVYYEHKDLIHLLVAKGCNLKALDYDKDNILHWAARSRNVDIMSYVWSKHLFDIDSRGIHGWTPIFIAATEGNMEVYDFLESKGASLNGVDDYNDTIFHVACLSDHVRMVKHILSQNIVDIDSRGGKGRTAVMTAAVNGNDRVFDLLVSEGCDLKTVDNSGNNILHFACFSGHVNMLKHILSKNILSINSKGKKGRTPVMIAVLNGKREALEYLVRKGCNLEVVDTNNNNIYHVACYKGDVKVVKYLVQLGVRGLKDVNTRGLIPLQMAKTWKRMEVVSFLRGRI